MGLSRTVCILILIMSLFSFSACARNSNQQAAETRIQEDTVVSQAEWMKVLRDTLLVCKISIPGTHDSGTTKGGSMLQTQSSDILSQLQQGIRAFDIRLQKKDNKLGIYHSHAFQDIYWEDDVLPAFLHFLQEHPTETLIVSLKKEGGELQDYASLLSASLSETTYQPYFVKDFSPELTLKDCRGKILFLHRDRAMEEYPGAACIGWKDNATCELTLRNNKGLDGFVLLQDEYQYKLGSGKEAEKKIEACIRNFKNISAEPAASRRWGISFVSATGLPLGTPLVFANQINKPVTDYIKKAGKQSYGIVFIDFVYGREGDNLVKSLIKSNFNR